MPTLESFSQRFINQRAAIEHIDRFLDLEDPTRGLIVSGREQCGKSFFLEWLLEEHTDLILGEDIFDIGDHSSAPGLVSGLVSGLKRAGVALPQCAEHEESNTTIYLNAIVNNANMSGAKHSSIQVEAMGSQATDILMNQAKDKLWAVESDLNDQIDSLPNLIILVDNIHRAEEMTGKFFVRHVLATLAKFATFRYVVSEGGKNPRLGKNAILQRMCPCLSVKMRPMVTEDDVVEFMHANDDWVVPPENYKDVASRLVEDCLGNIPAIRNGLDQYQGRDT